MTGRFETRMTWNGSGNGHWDVVLSGMVDGRMRVLATIPLDEWISLGAMPYVLELTAAKQSPFREPEPEKVPIGVPHAGWTSSWTLRGKISVGRTCELFYGRRRGDYTGP
jgi:hypothetical protein